jgi:hypothetical protein
MLDMKLLLEKNVVEATIFFFDLLVLGYFSIHNVLYFLLELAIHHLLDFCIDFLVK